jgi:ribonucleoside-diphosphate reductase alpha chain
VFNETGNQVQQGGIRRAALIAIMRVDHPDIVEFIRAKEVEGTLKNFNMSVLLTNKFMRMVNESPEDLWACTFGDKVYYIKEASKKDIEKDPESPQHVAIQCDTVPEGSEWYTVGHIWNLMVEKAWINGEPGIIFWDELNKGDIFGSKFGKLGVNPCGELPLLPYESCNLGAINLAKCIKEGDDGYRVDYEKIARLTKLGVRFLDNVIDINNFPLPEIETWTLKTRKIGLGTMGLHDLMLKRKIKYGSNESLNLIDRIYGTIKKEAIRESQNLGKIRGIPKELKDISQYQRNAGLLTVQPTGTISIICNQASSGIEPVFQWVYTRKDSYGTHEIKHFMLDFIEKKKATPPDYMVTALEVSPEEHVRVQAQVQKYIDSSISKTVNLPNTATREDIDRIFRLAHETKCKSVTVYRNESRRVEVLNKRKEEPERPPERKERAATTHPTVNSGRPPRTRDSVLFGGTYKINTPGGKAYITVNEDGQGIREVFIHISKAGSEITTHVEAEGRLISHALKHNIPVDLLISHLEGHKSNPIFDRGRVVKSVPDAVALVLQDYKDNFEGFSEFIEEGYMPSQDPPNPQLSGEHSGDLCPDCGEVLYRIGGCNECTCGYSQCG